MVDPAVLWCESLQHAYLLARGERLTELRGTKGRFLDARGLHPFSAVWGRVEAAEALLPELFTEESRNDPKERIPRDVITCSAVALKTAAREDADAEFRAEVILEAAHA